LKTSVREFADHDGFCPGTKTTGSEPPPAGKTQMSNSLPACRVNAIHLPSGDQSGSVGFAAPVVFKYSTAPPPAGILASRRRPFFSVAKQIQLPSGDQHGDESWMPVVSRFKFYRPRRSPRRSGCRSCSRASPPSSHRAKTDAPVFSPE